MEKRLVKNLRWTVGPRQFSAQHNKVTFVYQTADVKGGVSAAKPALGSGLKVHVRACLGTRSMNKTILADRPCVP
jgi:hypothetical protein